MYTYMCIQREWKCHPGGHSYQLKKMKKSLKLKNRFDPANYPSGCEATFLAIWPGFSHNRVCISTIEQGKRCCCYFFPEDWEWGNGPKMQWNNYIRVLTSCRLALVYVQKITHVSRVYEVGRVERRRRTLQLWLVKKTLFLGCLWACRDKSSGRRINRMVFRHVVLSKLLIS